MKIFYRARYVNIKMSRFKGPAILYANHKSALDPLLIGGVYVPFVNWVAKDSLFRYPVLGWLLKTVGAIPIRRGKNDAEAIKRVFEVVRNKGVVAIFPEGTRIRQKITDREKIKISRSPILIASKTGAPIIPIAIKGEYKLFRRMTLIFGEPIYIPVKEDGCDYTNEELIAISRGIMYRIYDAENSPTDDVIK